MLREVLSITGDLLSTHDLDYLLTRILSDARRLLRAESGSVFLVDGDRLRFTYVQNDRLFPDQPSHELQYVGAEIPIDETSLAGYVAKTGQTLNLEDVYQIPADKPYQFNRSFDQSSGYRTRSMLVVPLTTSSGNIVGVLEVINALDGEGEVVPFSEADRMLATFYGNQAAMAVERAAITRELILRTIRMAQLRDPTETGAHVNRVGSYAAEIYQHWAKEQGLAQDEIQKQKDLIRVAAMLHDVGKVAISDTILKKPGRLTPEEFQVIKYHTVHGARLFGTPVSELDRLARDIALNHHERYDGKGYPGHIPDLHAPEVELGPGKKGEEVPISARITALADVYDALISPRVYKDPWPEEKVLDIIEQERGRQFDPAVVEAFFAVYDVISLIRTRYSE
jgi:HD-GYP domain-containing protein (c-di-GMP phosphodiesterase class II)